MIVVGNASITVAYCSACSVRTAISSCASAVSTRVRTYCGVSNSALVASAFQQREFPLEQYRLGRMFETSHCDVHPTRSPEETNVVTTVSPVVRQVDLRSVELRCATIYSKVEYRGAGSDGKIKVNYGLVTWTSYRYKCERERNISSTGLVRCVSDGRGIHRSYAANTLPA
jgi:hypothetical protein